jgi:hypothetical protein
MLSLALHPGYNVTNQLTHERHWQPTLKEILYPFAAICYNRIDLFREDCATISFHLLEGMTHSELPYLNISSKELNDVFV